jgi:hypothetical protein
MLKGGGATQAEYRGKTTGMDGWEATLIVRPESGAPYQVTVPLKDMAEDAQVSQVPKEARPERAGFTGTTIDALGRVYHWVNGVRVPGPEDAAVAPTNKAAEEPSHEPVLGTAGEESTGGRVPAGEPPGE